MVSIEQARALAMEYPETQELPHFEKASFRVRKKIFLTLHPDGTTAVIKLTLPDQATFCSSPDQSIQPVPNKWGAQGWTRINLKKVKKGLFKDALDCSWRSVAPKTLIDRGR